MKNNLFHPRVFFDMTDFRWKEIFEGIDFIWEVLPKLEEFIKRINGNKKIVLGEGSSIHPSAEVSGYLLAGKHTRINHAAFLRQNVIIGDYCIIGHAVELKNCIVLSHTNIAHLNYVGDSIIGGDVNISGGAMLANFRFDKKPVAVKYQQKKIATNLLKFGSVVGDGSQIGANSVLNPGTILGKNTIVYPLQMVGGYHKKGEVIKT